jgi:pimeloyl-ACP methyl ester carboxylesterase
VGQDVTYEEHPGFVSMGGERMCAVVCLPEADVREPGVVLLSGANGRTHRNRMWVRLARALADRGIPSIRFDYPGIGDSTAVKGMRFDIERPMVAEVEAAASFLQRAAGVRRLALVATCFGARTAIAFAAQHRDAVAVTAFPSPLLTQVRISARSRVRQEVQRTRVGWALLRSPLILRIRRSVAGRSRPRDGVVSQRTVDDLVAFLARGTVRFVYGEETTYLDDLKRCVAQTSPRLDDEARGRLIVDIIPGIDLHRYATLEEQDTAIDKALASISETSDALAPVGPDRLSRA